MSNQDKAFYQRMRDEASARIEHFTVGAFKKDQHLKGVVSFSGPLSEARAMKKHAEKKLHELT